MKHGEGQSLQYRSCGHTNFPIRHNMRLLVWCFRSSSYEQIPLQTKVSLETPQNTTLYINKIK
jgi:hypothetical protein